MDNFFVGSNKMLNVVTNSTELVKSEPALTERFDAIAELRALDDGTIYRAQPFKRVASILAPLLEVAHLLEPDFLKNKRKFYSWLDANSEYCTYDRRAALARAATTFHGWRSDGIPGIRESASPGSQGGSP